LSAASNAGSGMMTKRADLAYSHDREVLRKCDYTGRSRSINDGVAMALRLLACRKRSSGWWITP
jgi:hypothetical protein